MFGMEYHRHLKSETWHFRATVLNGLPSSTSVFQKNCGLTLNCAVDLIALDQQRKSTKESQDS